MARLNGSARPQPARKSRAARATSCGGILLRALDGRREICLGQRRREKHKPTWTLPKGTPSAGETIDQTALREVLEETGLEVRIVAPVGAIEYFFTQDGQRIHKTVHYFLMEVTGGSLDAHDHEFDEVRWVNLEDAWTLMTFPTERHIVEQALPIAAISSGGLA